MEECVPAALQHLIMLLATEALILVLSYGTAMPVGNCYLRQIDEKKPGSCYRQPAANFRTDGRCYWLRWSFT